MSMYNGKRFLAIIPARSGSKGLKDKNIKELDGKPMIAYTIEAAKKSGIFSDIVVSTDSDEYAAIAVKYGATVPFMRTKELASDSSNSLDVITYTINELSKRNLTYDYFMLLQPTSPLRDDQDIRNAVSLLFEKDANAIVSVCEAEHSPLLTNTLNEALVMDDFLQNDANKRRQELPVYYRLNGAIYLSSLAYFMRYKNFYQEKSYAYIMNGQNSIDVDSIIDFELIKVIMNMNKA